MVLIKLGKQQRSVVVGGEVDWNSNGNPSASFGFSLWKLHKQPFEGLGLGGVFIVAFNFSCCYGIADFSFFLYPYGPVATWGLYRCAKSPPRKPHSDIHKIFVNVKYQ